MGATHRKEDEMVSKTLLDGKTVQVTFRMPPLEGVSELHLCGDFNDWNTTAAPLARQADGSWTTTLVLEPGKSYRYRFCDGEGRWHNDWQADAYVPNDFGSEDSVVVVAALVAERRPAPAEKPAPAAKPAPREPAAKKPPAKKPAAKPAARKKAAGKPAARKPTAAKKRQKAQPRKAPR
jgi:1,4-alpha-glucan branching enzyme